MRDYKTFVGMDINIVTCDGDSFRGPLLVAGKDTLTIQAKQYVPAGSDDGKELAGRIVVDRYSIHYVQVIG